MSTTSLTATLTSIHQMTPRVKQYVLQVKGHVFDYKPGQHTVISIGQGENMEARPYTPVTLPGTDKLVLGIKRYEEGTVSGWMDRRAPGDTVTIDELTGNLFLRNLDHDAVFLSTGTGITPMMAMLRHYLQEGSGQATFLYGERTQQDIMFRETLDQLDADHDALTVAYALSDEAWAGRTGHIQTHVEDVVDGVEHTDFYVCGVPQMVVDTKDVLADWGVPDEHVHSEGWEEGAVDA